MSPLLTGGVSNPLKVPVEYLQGLRGERRAALPFFGGFGAHEVREGGAPVLIPEGGGGWDR